MENRANPAKQHQADTAPADAAARLKHYADLFETAPIARLVMARDGTLIQHNQRARQLFGLAQTTPTDALIQLVEYMAADSHAAFSHFLEQVFSGQPGVSCEVMIRDIPESPHSITGIAQIVRLEARLEANVCNVTATDVSASHAAQIETDKKLALLNRLITQVPGILFQLHLATDGRLTYPYLSEVIRRMCGLEPDQATLDAEIILRCLHPLDAADFHATLRASAETLTPWRHEYRMLSDDEVRWREVDAQPERLADGSTLWHGYVVDITYRKQLEEAQQQNEERWKFALEGACDAVWDWNAQTRQFDYSPRWWEILGFSEAQVEPEAFDSAKESLDRVHPDDLAIIQANRQALLDGSALTSNIEWQVRCKNGEWKWIHTRGRTLIRDADGKPVRIVGTNSDITERKLLEQALRTNEERWKLALEGAGDGVWDWDVSSNTISYSTRWKEMLGYNEDEISHLPDEWFNRVHPDDVATAEANGQRLMDGATRITVIELRMRAKNGTWKWILSRGIVVARDQNGRPLRVVGTNTDITQRKQMEERLRESEERWKFALEGAGDGVWDLDAKSGAIMLSALEGNARL